MQDGAPGFACDNANRGATGAKTRERKQVTETIYWALAETNLGQMLLAHTERGICRLSFDEGEAELAVRFPNAALVEGGVYTRALVGSAIAAIRDPQNMPDLPLDLRGTAFQQAVWLALRDIPAGETRTYADIAAQIGQPNAVRATGSANGANPVSVLVPCHRVIRADGGLGGYAWGLERKRALLAREANEPALL
jgi:AraC family transcriptional regulator of adaptative response/methylated-DNA-[protein]-cysteine methyltransferase